MHIETSFYHVFLLCVLSPYQIIYSECAFICVCHIKVIYIKTSLSSHPTLCVKSKDLMFFHFVCQVPIKSSTASVCLCGCHIKVTHIEKSPIKVIDIETTFHKWRVVSTKSWKHHELNKCVPSLSSRDQWVSQRLLSKSSTSRRLFISEESSRPSHPNTTNSISLYQIVMNECIKVFYPVMDIATTFRIWLIHSPSDADTQIYIYL